MPRRPTPLFSFTLALLLLLAAAPAQAQRTTDAGPPQSDPFGRREVAARAVPGGRYRAHSFNEESGVLTIRATDGSARQVEEWNYGVVKISYFAPGRVTEADSSVGVAANSREFSPDGVVVSAPGSKLRIILANPSSATAGTVRLLTNHGTLIIQKNTLQVSWLYGDAVIFSEANAAFRRVAQTPATAGTSVAAATFAPGGTAVRFRLRPGERLYGTGSRALPLDRRGNRLELYNQAHYGSQNGEQNLNITLPTVLSSRGYMVFFDHHAPGYLELGKAQKDVLEYGAENLNSLSYYVITGRSQAEILDRYTALTGRQPLPPRWALGLIQSRFGYKSEAEMQAVAARMRRENFPLDALVLDLYWFGGTTRQGDLRWEPRGFPDPAGMMARLKQQGVKTILISEPYVMRTSINDSLVRTHQLVGTDAAGRPFTVGSFWAGPASILDVFKPRARRWLWANYQRLHDQGAAGWWSDLGEPENHPAAMRHVAGPARAVHNAYGQAWASIFAENYAQHYPDERVFNLARSGWAGMQRNSVFPWSGDINRSWSGYQAQVPVMLGLGQGGVGYMHSDAGGFCVGPIDAELYTRWLQMASLCPILRPHGESVPPEPYFYPDPYKSSVRDAVQLRYRLLPYLYTLAWQNTTTGAPLVRTTDYDSRVDALRVKGEELSDSAQGWEAPVQAEITPPSLPSAELAVRLANLNDQYLLGPNLLVAPVLHAGQRRRNVVLPAGNWIDFHSNQIYAGGQTVGVPAPLAHAPLLVRAGALLPMTAYRPSTAQFRPDTLQLRYYPDPQTPESSFTLYEDDGHSAQALAKNQFALLTLAGKYSPTKTDIILASNGGHYPGQPARRRVQLLVQRVAAAPTAIFIGGAPLPASSSTVAFDAARQELRIEFVLLAARVVISLPGLRLATTPAAPADPNALTLETPDSRSFGRDGTTLHLTRHLAPGASELPTPLRLRNALGAVVRELPLPAAASTHNLPFDARDAQGQPLPPGVYTAEVAGQHQRLIVQAE
ncbi:TIM-barrel domain-containing protein [uncultured Hymenobacter sp.]|uniref:TIM-barrel domain-containing protein n=1 Tax=uncultured Hymenobacter sp. TaxID=170016 RepID=UPI0035CAFE2A